MDDLVIGRDGEEVRSEGIGDLEEMKTPELAEADLLVWMGDLNYRVEGVPYEHARHQVAARNLPALLASDQLLREMAGGRAFRGMEEGLIAFPPTYKFDRGTPDPLAYDSGEKRRVPAWCDRVLFRDSFTPSLPPMLPPTLAPILAPSLPLSLSMPAAPNHHSQPLVSAPQRAIEEQECTLAQPVKAHVLRYDACMEAIQSDHKPVRCLLDVSVASVDLPATRCLLGRLLTLSSQTGQTVRAGGGFPLWLKVLPGAGILIAGGSMTINFCMATSHAAPPGSPAAREHIENTRDECLG
ncbi:unnamed protein product [Closterium sp. NIES-64]|nr:unnamed protein product [Closterium sp. NIES-64]